MAERLDSNDRKKDDRKTRIGRRRLLTQGAALGAGSSLLAGCSGPKPETGLLADQNLVRASALSGEPLSPERVRAMKPMLEFTLRHLEVLRTFDPDEEEPSTIFRFGKE
jgi:hypothetical protein